MKDNILGLNIKHLRKIQKETQKQLADYLHVDERTVQGYEAGRRRPDLSLLIKIAAHYGKTVDALLLYDLTEAEPIGFDFNSVPSVMDALYTIFPIYSSDDAMKNNYFKKGYELSQKLLKGFSKNEIMPGDIIVRIFEAYAHAADESGSPESIANILWCLFIWWNQLYDKETLINLRNKQMSKKLTFKATPHNSHRR